MKFIEKHKTVILQMAYQVFSRNKTILSKRANTDIIKVVKGGNNKSNKLTVVTRDTNEKNRLIGEEGFIVCNEERPKKRETIGEFNARLVDPSVVARMVPGCEGAEDENDVKREERVS